MIKPVPPVVIGFDGLDVHDLRAIIESGEDDQVPVDVALDILCNYANYGIGMAAYEEENKGE